MEQFNSQQLNPTQNGLESSSTEESLRSYETINEKRNIDLELLLLGFYQLPGQNMHPEAEYVEDAKKLAKGLFESFKIIESLDSDSHIKDLFETAVFIFKDQTSKLYAFFPKKGIARISKVVYDKRNIKHASPFYQHWFKVGENFFNNNDILQDPIIKKIKNTKSERPFFYSRVKASDLNNGIKDEFGVLYDLSRKRLLQAPKELLEYQIPEGVETICSYAFRSCNIKKITLPNSLRCIGWYAFSCCRSLANIYLPEGLLRIEHKAFEKCIMLSSMNIPSSIDYIGENPFAYCNNICLNNNSPHYLIEDNLLIEQANNRAISYLGKEEDLKVPSYVNEIGKYACANCRSIRRVSMSDNVRVINDDAFIDCRNLVEIALPNSIEDIGQYVFSTCLNLKTINIPINLKHICVSTFNQCMSIESIVLPDSIKGLLSSAFESCSSLKEIKLSENLEYINDKAFQSCYSLNSIIFPKSLTRIGDKAFRYCESLSSIWFYCNDLEVGRDAFLGCKTKVVHTVPGNLNMLKDIFPFAEIYEDLNDI